MQGDQGLGPLLLCLPQAPSPTRTTVDCMAFFLGRAWPEGGRRGESCRRGNCAIGPGEVGIGGRHCGTFQGALWDWKRGKVLEPEQLWWAQEAVGGDVYAGA